MLNRFTPPGPTTDDGYTRIYEPPTDAPASSTPSWIGPARNISPARRRLRCPYGEHVCPRSLWERYVLHEHGVRVDGSFRELTGTAHPVRVVRCTVAVTVELVRDSGAVDDERFRI